MDLLCLSTFVINIGTSHKIESVNFICANILFYGLIYFLLLRSRVSTIKKTVKGKIQMTTRELEERIKQSGYTHVIGVDEVGRGCLAGPVVVCACILPPEFKNSNVKDSKKITTERKREKIYEELVATEGLHFATVSLDADVVDTLNILGATMKGMKQATEDLIKTVQFHTPDAKFYVLVDGDKFPRNLNVPGETVLQGDSCCVNIAAASIIAKVTRDRIMNQFHETYPDWNFVKHKGYGTANHRGLITSTHYTPLHRKSFQPLRGLLENVNEM